MDWLDEAVRRGVISAQQRETLMALERDFEPRQGRAPGADGGFNWPGAAYTIGALLVLFALGWFLVDRWSALGATGVLAVVAVYAVLFLGLSRKLSATGFPTASAVALLLVIGCVPLATWAILSLTGEWPLPGSETRPVYYNSWMATRWIIVSLATILASLVALRRRRSALLVIPAAVSLWWIGFHLNRIILDGVHARDVHGWVLVANSMIILGIAERIERFQRSSAAEGDAVDHAQAFWIVGMAAFAYGYASLWNDNGPWAHLLAPVSLAVIALALTLGRRALFFFGLAGVFAYLAWLAGDVFRTGAVFPIVLALVGLILIVLAVWVQRRFPGLLARKDGQRPLLWSPVMAWVPAGFAIAMALLSLPDITDARAQREFSERLRILQGHSGSQRARMNTTPDRRPTAVEGTLRAPDSTPARPIP